MSYAKRIPCFDGLRGIAALGVVLFHYNLFFLPQARLPFVGRAYLAVDLFFLLSGFVMAHVYGEALASNRRAHWRRYASARFARIYPLFAVTTLAMVLLATVSHLRLLFVSFSAYSLALQPALLQQWDAGLSWNYPSWSISTEAECYVIFIFSASMLMDGKYPRLLAGCCIGVVTVLSLVSGGSLNYFVGIFALLRSLAEFSLGALLYRAHVNTVGSPRYWVLLLALPLAAVTKVTHLDFFMVAAFGCLLFYCTTATDLFARFLNSRALLALGNWSYGIYLWHAPTHFAVMVTFAMLGLPVSSLGQSNSRLLLLATCAIVVGLSALHYRYFETPLRRRLLATLRIDPAFYR